MSIVQRLLDVFEEQQQQADCWCCGDVESTTDSADGGASASASPRRRRPRQVRFQTHRSSGKEPSSDNGRSFSRRRSGGRSRNGSTSWSTDRSGNTSGSSTQDTTATDDTEDRSLSRTTESPRHFRSPGAAASAAAGSPRRSSLKKGTAGGLPMPYLGYVDTWPQPSRTLSDDWSEMLDVSAHPSASFDAEDRSRDDYSWDTPQRQDSGPPPSNPHVPVANDTGPSTPRREFSRSTQSHLRLRARSGQEDAHEALLELAALCWPIDECLDDVDRRRHGSTGPDVVGGAGRAPEILWEAMAKFPLSASVHVEAFRVAIHLAEQSPAFCRAATAGPAPRGAEYGAWDRAAPRLLEPILAGMRRFWTQEEVQVYGAGALLALVRHSEARTELLMERLQGGTVVAAAMTNFLGSRDLQELGLLLFATAGEVPRFRLPLIQVGGLRVADAVLQWHSDDGALVQLARETVATLCDDRRGGVSDAESATIRHASPPNRREASLSDTEQEWSDEPEEPYPAVESNCDELALNLVRSLLGRAEAYYS